MTKRISPTNLKRMYEVLAAAGAPVTETAESVAEALAENNALGDLLGDEVIENLRKLGAK